jgi:hypothetical protein
MTADKQLIKNTLINSLKENSAAVFALGSHYVQTAAISPQEIYCEAVSHHYHSLLDISLETAFTNLGFHLEEGGNYSRRYLIESSSNINKLAEDIVYIFENIYESESGLPFEISEL